MPTLMKPGGRSVSKPLSLCATSSEPMLTATSQSRRRNTAYKNEPDTASSSEEDSPAPRKSSRTNKFSNSMADPTMDEFRLPPSPTKTPARQHARARLNVREKHHAQEDSEISSSSASESEDEEEPLKMQRILASRTEKRKTWLEICQGMNTSEIEQGSRWFQKETVQKDPEVFEERFLVKWSDLGYLHCSWETQDDLLEQVNGAKTYLTTFFRKSEGGILFSADERCDGDYFDPAFNQIDRVLEVQHPDSAEVVLDKSDPGYEDGTGRQFLIKWCNSPYADATYEFERDLIVNDVEYIPHVEAFEARNTKPSEKDFKESVKKGSKFFKSMEKAFGSEAMREKAGAKLQADLESKVYKNGGQLRDYQAEGIAWMISNYVDDRSSILADEMGLGKTLQVCSRCPWHPGILPDLSLMLRQTAAFINFVATEINPQGVFLVVAPLSTITHWYREFTRWTDLNTIIYHGSAEDRRLIRELEMAYEVNRPSSIGMNQLYLRKCLPKRGAKYQSSWMVQVVITTPEMLVTDDFAELTAIDWDMLVVDEAHRLKNLNSKLGTNLRDSRFDFDHKLLLTGTPIQNDVQEFWTLLNFIDPEGFDDADEFLDKYGDMKSKERVDELHDEIRPYILRRLKEDVEKSVPPKEETLIEVELTVAQKKYYRALYEKNVRFLHSNKRALDGPSLNNLAMQLRKCCNHLFLLNGVEDDFRKSMEPDESEADFLAKASGKLVLLDKLLPRLQSEGHRVLLFSQFKIMLDIIEDYFNARGMTYERIDGSITGNKRQQAIDRYQAPKVEGGKDPPFVMMLSTRAGGVGINLTAADTW